MRIPILVCADLARAPAQPVPELDFTALTKL